MANLSEQIFVSLCLPMDARLANLTQEGSNIIVETQSEYLNRVDQNSRYLGMPVVFHTPAGTYDINTFLTNVNNGIITQTKYTFTGSLLDSSFVEVIESSSSDAALTETIIVSGVDDWGGISNGDVLEEGLTFTDYVKKEAQKRNLVNYVQPTSALSISPSSTQEVGASISFTLTPSYTQNNGGAVNSVVFKLDGTIIHTQASLSAYIDVGRVVPAGVLNYSVSISYDDGPILEDSFGDPSPGSILAGTLISSKSVVGSYRSWFGLGDVVNSSEARSLNYSYSGTFSLNTGTIGTKFSVVLPPTKTLISVIDEDAFDADLVDAYEYKGSFVVDDGGGNSINCSKYLLTLAVPYANNHTHNITIS